jgi:hypothetical protein
LEWVKIAYEWGRLHGEEHYKLRLLPAIVRVRVDRWEGVGARIILKWGLGKWIVNVLSCI